MSELWDGENVREKQARDKGAATRIQTRTQGKENEHCAFTDFLYWNLFLQCAKEKGVSMETVL